MYGIFIIVAPEYKIYSNVRSRTHTRPQHSETTVARGH